VPDSFARFRRTHEFWLLVGIVLLCLLFSTTTDTFLTLENLEDLVTGNAYVGILCAGLLVVLIAGGIDISYTATASVAQYVALTITNKYPAIGWAGVFIIACGVGAFLGLINATVIYKLKIKSIIASIALLNIYFGFLIFFSGGSWIYVFPSWFRDGIDWFAFTGESGYTYSVNLQILAVVLAFATTWVVLRGTNVGRQIYAMGGNPDAAQRVGFSIYLLHLIAYGYLGMFAGLASVVQAQLAQTVMPNSLVGRELDVLAAVVLGGASLNGGVGSVLGAVLGVTLLAIMQNGLVLLGVSSYWFLFISGFVILVSMSSTAIQTRRALVRRRIIVTA
jgi:simple sugar transport system permease protein